MTDSNVLSGSSDFDRTTANFAAWFAASNGTRLSPKFRLEDLRAQNAGRGAVAKEDIAEDEELFAIPRSLVLTTTTSSIPPSVLLPLQDTGSWPPLIVTIIYEYLRKEHSPWYPYFEILPTTFDSLMFWTPQELAELQASAVVNKIGKASAEQSWAETIIPVMLQWSQLFPVAGRTDGEKTAALINLAHMAGSLIMAYAFDIDRDDAKSENNDTASDADDFEEDDEDEPLKGMVPLADMLNADADKNNARLYQEPDYLIMKATKPIRAGDQIFNDYGPLPRSDLLRMYGYVTGNYAQYDVVEISYDLLLEVAGKKHNPKNSAWAVREEQLDDLGLLDDGYAIPRPAPGATQLHDVLPGQLHMLLRALCAHDTDSSAMEKPKDAVTIEEAALLQSALTMILSGYSTSYETDQVLWDKLNADGTDNEVPSQVDRERFSMALQVRMGEKDIFRQIILLCQDHIKRQSVERAESAPNASSKRKHDSDQNSSSKRTARTEKHRR